MNQDNTTCAFDECGRPIRANGLCNAHAVQWHHHKTLKPLKERASNTTDWSCKYPDCDRPKVAKGYCSGHYRQSRAGEEVRELQKVRRYHEIYSRDKNGNKQCVGCKSWKPEKSFSRHQSTQDGFTHRCKECLTRDRKESYLRKDRAAFVLKTYGITMAEYDQMFERQGSKCAVCQASESGGRGWHVDHDHACCPAKSGACGKCVRGILCARCNMTLGLVQDNESTLAGMIAYLRESPVNCAA